MIQHPPPVPPAPHHSLHQPKQFLLKQSFHLPQPSSKQCHSSPLWLEALTYFTACEQRIYKVSVLLQPAPECADASHVSPQPRTKQGQWPHLIVLCVPASGRPRRAGTGRVAGARGRATAPAAALSRAAAPRAAPGRPPAGRGTVATATPPECPWPLRSTRADVRGRRLHSQGSQIRVSNAGMCFSMCHGGPTLYAWQQHSYRITRSTQRGCGVLDAWLCCMHRQRNDAKCMQAGLLQGVYNTNH